MLTQERLKELFNYDPTTGVFTNRVHRSPNARKGWKAGCDKSHGYQVIRVDGTLYGAHRLAWLYVYGSFPEGVIDHINQDPLDNRISNLRDVEQVDNMRNMRILNTNKSGITGVSWDKANNKWRASINIGNKGVNLGRYSELNDAIKARREANLKYGFHENHGNKRGAI